MADTQTADLGFDFDPKALREKYLEERNKRVRPDASDQYLYIEHKGKWASLLDDPHADPNFTRAPLTDHMDVIVVGGGFSGLQAAARLREAGVKDIRIVEKGADFGGTWYWNRYPGAACDTESYCYMPLLEETGYMPTRKYARSKEIFEHAQRIGRYFDLYKDACFQTELTEMRWDEERACWVIRTDRNDEMTARFVVMGSGFLNRAKLPGIPGVETFKGHTFHTSRWDYDYTGGSAEGGMSGLNDKRVGIIGTGATAVQCIPFLGEAAKHLYVFQRTPSSIDERNDRTTDPAWAQSLEPGWQKRRMYNFDGIIAGIPQEEDLVNDGWTEIFSTVTSLTKTSQVAVNSDELRQLADFQKMEKIRSRVSSIVKKPDTAEALKPYYNQLCKRPCFHDQYLDTFNRANVTLVDTKGAGVERITEKGVVVDGKEYELDCIVFATGFEIATSYTHRANFEAYGRDGVALGEKWANSTASLHGIMAHGFPNYFILGGAQSALTINLPFILDEQAKHIASVIQRCETDQIRAVEASQKAEDAWQQEMVDKSVLTRSFIEECTPGYLNNEGRADGKSWFLRFYGGGPFGYIDVLKTWRETAFEKDLTLTYE